jgi:hypothetical protein
MDDDIDDSWIKEFKKQEDIYNDFYKEETNSIKLFFLYVNASKTLESVKSDSLILEGEGVVTKDQLVSLIKDNQRNNSVRYRLLSLIKFNIDVEPNEVMSFIEGDDSNSNSFTTSEKYLNDIKFQDTICMLQDLNSLFFVFYEDKRERSQSTTKKITFHSGMRKTRRKRT